MDRFYYPVKFNGYTVPENGTKFARLSQQIECSSSEVDPFDLALFGFTQEHNNIRELLYQVDVSHDSFQELVDKHPQCRIIRILSYEPILSLTERMMVDKGVLKITPFMENQLVRFQDGLFLDRQGMPVYAKNRLTLSGDLPDQDLRIPFSDADLQIGDAEPVHVYTIPKY